MKKNSYKKIILNRNNLKNLPIRKNEVTQYSEIFLIPSGLKHESGYMTIAIVGKLSDGSFEVCAYPDDIIWDMTLLKQDYDCTGMRTDCSYPGGILHLWGRMIKFVVGNAYSSTTIRVENL